MSNYVIIRQYFVKMCKIVCFQQNIEEFVVLYFGHFMDYQNSFKKKKNVRRVHRCFTQSLVQIAQIALEEFEKVSFSFVVIL